MAIVDADSRIELRRVEVLRRDGDRVFVASGIAPQERVVSGPLTPAVDGMRVRVVEEREALSGAVRETDGDGDKPLASSGEPV